MEIEQKAQEYAKKKAESFLNDAFAEAYKQGFADGVASVKSNKEPIVVDGVEYVDLGLPSGKLWAKELLRDGWTTKTLCYDEALEYNIPTLEDIRELLQNCKQVLYTNNVNFIGVNGNSVSYKKVNSLEYDSKQLTWISGDCDFKNRAYNVLIDECAKPTTVKAMPLFKGCHTPVILVK